PRPLRHAAPFDLDFKRSALRRERIGAPLLFGYDHGLVWTGRVDQHAVVPGSRRMNFPIRGWRRGGPRHPFFDLAPVFADLEREDERATLDGHRAVRVVHDANPHWQLEDDSVTSLPSTGDGMDPSCLNIGDSLAVQRYRRCSRPRGNAQSERKLNR